MIKDLFKLPIKRLFFYLIALSLLPVIFVLSSFFKKKQEGQELFMKIHEMKNFVFLKQKKEETNNAVRYFFDTADHFYIDKNLETIHLLQKEIDELQMIVNDKNFANDNRVNNRLQFLLGKENSLSFVESAVESHPLMQETQETLSHPVEVDISDLQKIFSYIEGVSIKEETPPTGRPQLIISECKLDKKKISSDHEVFSLQLKFIKREFS